MKNNRNRNSYRISQEKMNLFRFGRFAKRSGERRVRKIFDTKTKKNILYIRKSWVLVFYILSFWEILVSVFFLIPAIAIRCELKKHKK
jgi:hypothetical protein